jgi:GNAT superfamily N-acetyltransferase
MLLGDHMEYVPPPERPELYVKVLLTASAWRGRGVGRLLIDHAIAEGRSRGVEQLRVDCWDGVPELPAQYERLGFTRVGSFTVNPAGRGDWHGAILRMDL